MTMPLPPSVRPHFPTIPKPPVGLAIDKNRKLATVSVDSHSKSQEMDAVEVSAILDRTLSPKRRDDVNILNFIKTYLECRNVAQTSRTIGITVPTGQRIRGMADVHAAIQAISDRAVMKHGFDAAEIIERVKEVANIDPAEMCNPDGSFIENLKDIPYETRRGIKKFKAKNLYDVDPNGVRVVVGKVIEVEFWDKLKAVEMLGSEVGTFKKTQRIEHEIGKKMSNILLDSKRRADERVIDVSMYSNTDIVTPTETEVTV